MKITFQSPPKVIDEKMISNILRDYKLLNCEVLVRDEYGTLPWSNLDVISPYNTNTSQPRSTTSST